MEHHANHKSSYKPLILMTSLSFLSMYALMYAMVNRWPDVLVNINQVFMAGLMTAPMVILEMVLMGGMYRNQRLNLMIIAGTVVAMAGCWIGIRTQAGVTDRQFLRSMIPHHSGALLMCRQADINDAEIKALCSGIMSGQQDEIDQMRAALARLEK